MQPGRGPSWNITAGLEQSAWLEAVELASDGRLLLPQSLRKRVRWSAPDSSLPLLATIGPDSEVGLQPLSGRQTELAALRRVLSEAEPSARASLALAAMATYFQISLQPDGRLRLPPGLARHLRTQVGSWIWVTAYADEVALWSDEAWALVMKRRSTALQDAMAKTRLTSGPSEAAPAS